MPPLIIYYHYLKFMSNTIKIKKEDAKKRLDVFLAEKYKENSRSFWQKRIKNGDVLLNKEKVTPHIFLKENDKITIKNYKEDIKKVKLKYKLLYEDKDYLIIEKPEGLLTHRTEKEEGLADLLLIDYPEIESVGEEYRWGIVHRLDRDVSGVLLVARTKKFYKYIKQQFKDRKVKKIYLGVVYGKIEKNEDDINFIIARSKNGKMAARPIEAEGREAITHFEVIKSFINYTYLKIQILTGRTHQIRVHMLAYGHPILGDNIYKVKKNQQEICDRMFLHSNKIGFYDLNGDWVLYESKLPLSLKNCLKELK